jgi:hypothetical protein
VVGAGVAAKPRARSNLIILRIPTGIHTRGAVGSGPAAVQSAAASVVALTCGVCVAGGFGWL